MFGPIKAELAYRFPVEDDCITNFNIHLHRKLVPPVQKVRLRFSRLA